MATTNTPAERVERFREQRAKRYPYEDHKAAYQDLLYVTAENASDALLAGDPTEALVWATIGNAHTLQYRRAV